MNTPHKQPPLGATNFSPHRRPFSSKKTFGVLAFFLALEVLAAREADPTLALGALALAVALLWKPSRAQLPRPAVPSPPSLPSPKKGSDPAAQESLLTRD